MRPAREHLHYNLSQRTNCSNEFKPLTYYGAPWEAIVDDYLIINSFHTPLSGSKKYVCPYFRTGISWQIIPKLAN